MIKPISALLVSTLVLTACGQSRLNPLNWFGRGERVEAPEQVGEVNPLIPQRRRLSRPEVPYQGELVAQLKDMSVERLPGGAVLRATGVTATQGGWDVQLIPLNDGAPVDRVLSYELRAVKASDVAGPERSRLVTAAVTLSDQDLAGVRSVQVIGANGAMVSRR